MLKRNRNTMAIKLTLSSGYSDVLWVKLVVAFSEDLIEALWVPAD